MWQNSNWRNWDLIIKLDPDKKIPSELLEQIIFSPSVDGVFVGGTQNITRRNTEDLIWQVKNTGYSGPLIQEISELEAVSFNVDGYLLPVVLNTRERDWFIGKHLEAVKAFGHIIDWSLILPEAYVICNPHCAAAQRTQAIAPSLDDLMAYLTLVEEVYCLPIIYLEYSGIYGNADWLKAIREQQPKTQVFYGGGIRSFLQAEEMMSLADTVVLGNIVYENPKETIEILEKLLIAKNLRFQKNTE
ncbi:MAG: heptaprenylglyceryl phosphate synthase [Dehalobacterium sp.]